MSEEVEVSDVRTRRHTTTSDRYQITDPVCGLVETATSLSKALRLASNHKCGNVEVFDVMARLDCVQVWDSKGGILAFRKSGTQASRPSEPIRKALGDVR